MPDTPLNPDALEAAYVAVSDESWLSARAARAVASAAVSAYLAVARPELQANSKPNQNFEVVNSLEILEAHDGYGFEVKGNIMHQGCMCGADCGRVTRTPDNVHRAHVAEVLDKHMQERIDEAVIQELESR